MKPTLRGQLAKAVRRADAFVESPFRKLVIVNGTFRSGTNLLKMMLQDYYNVSVVFSKWWWKHGLPPTHVVGRAPLLPPAPIVVVAKHPTRLNPSLYRFWQRRRPELDRGETLSEFIRREFIVYDQSREVLSPKYVFPTPTDYWNQYHYAYLNWKGVADRICFLQYERLVQAPQEALEGVADAIRLTRRNATRIALPERRLATSSDRNRAAALENEAFTTAPELAPDDARFVTRRMRADLAARLGYA
jgi:hypothetical protein